MKKRKTKKKKENEGKTVRDTTNNNSFVLKIKIEGKVATLSSLCDVQ